MLGCSKMMLPILRFVDEFLGTEILARNSTILRLLFAEDTRGHAEMATVVNMQPETIKRRKPVLSLDDSNLSQCLNS